jgi:cytoskeletal protein RodZ
MAPGGFVKNRIQSLSFVATLAVVFGMISWGSALAQTSPSTPADQNTPQTQPAPTPDTPPSQQTPQTQPTPTPDNPPATQQTPSSSSQMPSSSQTPSQTPDNTPAAGSSAGTPSAPADATSTGADQSFSGTVQKSGDKYVLKDDSGKVYDIDHQSDVAKFEGKRVRVKGTLDSTGSKIMVK